MGNCERKAGKVICAYVEEITMNQFFIKPEIQFCNTFQEFAAEYELGKSDVILTNEYIYNPIMAAKGLQCGVVFQEK